MNAYKRMGHGAKLTSAYMARLVLVAAVMYVNDTDLLHKEKYPTAWNEELIEQVWDATMDWTMLGQAKGGCLKLEKYRVYFQTYKFVRGMCR